MKNINFEPRPQKKPVGLEVLFKAITLRYPKTIEALAN